MDILKTVIEGGQIWTHRIRMAKQVLRIAFLLSLLIGSISFLFFSSRIPLIYYQAFFYSTEAQFTPKDGKILVSRKFWDQISHQRTSLGKITVSPATLQRACQSKVDIFWKLIEKTIVKSLFTALITFGSSVLYFSIKGIRSRRKLHIDGQEIIPVRQLALKLKFSNQASPIKIDILPMVKGTETHHTLISGATGQGKTNCFHHMLPQIREQRHKAIIVDTSGEFVAKYYREGKDILINPSDQRSVAWHPWAECQDIYDYKALSQSLIPSSYREEENFWRKAAQEVLLAALKEKAEDKRTSSLTRLLLHDPLATLSQSLEGTTAISYLDMASEKTAGSVRAVVASFLECLELLEDTEQPFSIRDWVWNDKDDSWLFLCSTVKQRAALTPLLSAWFSIAMHSLLQMQPNVDRRLWLIADELPSLNRLKDLETCLAQSRKYGGCALLAIQSPAQLEAIYGREHTRTIIGNCATRIAFADHDPETAARISKTFGEKEQKEAQEAISYGTHEMRDGVNLSYQTKTSAAVTATAIQSLEPLEAFVRLPGNYPIAKIKFKYQN